MSRDKNPMAQPSTSTGLGTGPTLANSPGLPASLYPQLESSIAPIDESEHIKAIVELERKFQVSFRNISKPLEDVADCSFLPEELFADIKKKPKSASAKLKIDPLRRLKDLQPNEEQEDEEEDPEDEEEDIDEEKVEDEEEDAGGDYLVTHFDNGENFEDNDDEGDDITSMI